MDIVAKHIPADSDGVRMAELDEQKYRRQLWSHTPLTDFWRVGKGYADRLAAIGIYTMGDIARLSLVNEDVLYRLSGINAELLIDHAWGWESCTMDDIKAYKSTNNSISSGQVLQEPYVFEKGKLIVAEMADQLALDLVDKGLVTDQIVLTVGYDVTNLSDPDRRAAYSVPVHVDHYGRHVPESAHGSIRLERVGSSGMRIVEAAKHLFDQIVNPDLLIRRINLSANHVVSEHMIAKNATETQLELFIDYEELARKEASIQEDLAKEKRLK